MPRFAPILLSFALAAVAGCASAPSGTTQTGTTPATRRDPNVISAEELSATPESDLYSAVARLRPAFFETRGPSSMGVGTVPEVIQVYIDGTRAGDPSSLRQLRPQDVKEVRKLSASDATQRFGTGNSLGAIVVTRK